MGSTEMKNDLAKGPSRSKWTLSSLPGISSVFTKKMLKKKKETEQKISSPDKTETKPFSHLNPKVGSRYILS